jgi:hypothetical protein
MEEEPNTACRKIFQELGPPMYEKLQSNNKRRTAEGHFFALCAEPEISETDISSETWPTDA